MLQACKGNLLHLPSNLVSAKWSVRSADKPVELSRSQKLNLGSFRAPFGLRKWSTGSFGPFPLCCRFCNFCRFGSFDQQVAGTGVQTGEYRLKTLYYRLQVKICRFCTLQILLQFAVICILMYKILWVWFFRHTTAAVITSTIIVVDVWSYEVKCIDKDLCIAFVRVMVRFCEADWYPK